MSLSPNDPYFQIPALLPIGPPSGDVTGATDLAAITAAIITMQAPGGTVQLRSGQTYIISTPNSKTWGTPSGGTTSLVFGIDIPSNVTLDLNGATIKAAAGATGTLVVNRTPTNGGGDVNIGLISSSGPGIIDGNNVVASPVGSRALVMVAWTTTPRVNNIIVQNGYAVGFWAYGNTRGNYDQITANAIKGGAISFGQPYATAMEFNATIGRILAMNTLPEPSNIFFNPGNGVYIVASGGTTVAITSINNTGGDKLDRPSVDHQITAVFGINNGDSGGNSGFKFQGGTSSSTTTSSSPARCEIGLVHMVNQNGAGLFMEGCVDCTVHKYVGENNGLLGGLPDVWLGGVRDTVSDLCSDNAFGEGVQVRQYAVDPRIGSLRVRNPNQSNTAGFAGLDQQGGNLTVDQIFCVDELPFPVNVTAVAQAGGGTFAGGVAQSYMLTYVNASGETTGSYEVSATPAASGSVVLTWGTGALPTGVTGVKVYRATASGGEFTTPALVATLGAVLTYTDTGSAVGAGAVPAINTATTLKMKFGVGQSTSRCVLQVNSLTVRGAATASVSANGVVTQTGAINTQMMATGTYIAPKTGNISTAQPAQGTCSAMPIQIGEAGTIAAIGVNVTTIGQAGALIRMGIYADNGHGLPGALLLDAGTVVGDTTGYKEIVTVLAIRPGRYFLAYSAQNCATTAPIVTGTTGNVDPPIVSTSGSGIATTSNFSAYQQAGVTGALPASWGAATAAGVNPRLVIKAL